MNRRWVIGFVGPSEAGKSEAAHRLVDRWGFVRVHAGMGVKDAARLGFHLGLGQVDGPDINRPAPQLGGVTPRAFLEAVGQAVHQVAPMATAERLRTDIATLPDYMIRVVVDGIRRPSEAAVVEQLKGSLIRIYRPDRPGNPDLPLDAVQADIKADVTIGNPGDDGFIKLHAQVDRLGRLIHLASTGGTLTYL